MSQSGSRQRPSVALRALGLAACLLGGCPGDDKDDKEEPKANDGGGSADTSKAGAGGSSTSAPKGGSGGSESNGDGSSACTRSSHTLTVGAADKLDLLFVVDNSNSMAGEQAALKTQLPAFIRTLSSGMRSADDPSPFPPVKDLHVGVVSTESEWQCNSSPVAINETGGKAYCTNPRCAAN